MRKKVLIYIVCLLVLLGGSNNTSAWAESTLVGTEETENKNVIGKDEKKNGKNPDIKEPLEEDKVNVDKEKVAEEKQEKGEITKKENVQGGNESVIGDKWHISMVNGELLIELKGNPDALDMRKQLKKMHDNNELQIKNTKKVIIRGTFGLDSENKDISIPWTDQLKEVRFEKSNFIPEYFFSNAKGLTKYSDDGSVTEFHREAMIYSPLEYIDSPNLNSIEDKAIASLNAEHIELDIEEINGDFLRFEAEKVKTISLPKLKKFGGEYFIYDAFMLEKVDVPVLETASGIFLGVTPKLKEVNAPKLSKADVLFYHSQFEETRKFRFPNLQFVNEIGYSMPPYGDFPLIVHVPKLNIDQVKIGNSSLIYTSLSPQNSYIGNVGEAIEIQAFGPHDKWKMGQALDIKWEKNGDAIEGKGHTIHVPIQEEGVDVYQPVLVQGNKNDVDFFREIKVVSTILELTAEAVPQEIALGSEITEQDAKGLVTNVRLGDKVLQPDEYNVEVLLQPDTNIIRDSTIQVKVSAEDGQTDPVSIDIPTNVGWGETLELLGGYSSNVIALTLHGQVDGTFKMTGTRGKKKGNGRVHTSFQSEYLGGSLFSVKDQISELDNLEEYYRFSVNGQDQLDQVYKNFESQIVKLGDVVQIRHNEILFFEHLIKLHHEGSTSLVGGDIINSNISFEVTKSGYKKLYYNQLEPKRVTVKHGATEEELNQKLQESIDL
ncbi:hypothetical protein, partial [Bacillus cereus]|uniref:hypothetical protein n=1 Tax=Bacillus cereus TaxID=1396 RepID=UPI000BFB068A